MTRRPDHDADSVDQPPGAGDAGTARDFGADLVAAVDLDAVDAQLARWPAADLLRELEAIVTAMESLDPARLRRRAGFLGRLLGRDLVAQAQPDPVSARVRLGLAAAQANADALVERSAALARLASTIQQQADRLAAAVADERTRLAGSHGNEPGAGVPSASAYRRLDHLDAIAASWRTSVAHAALVRSHAEHLLVRHAQVRDLMATLWRERTAAETTFTQIDSGGIARLHASLRDLASAIVPPQPAPHDPTTKEPSP